MPGPPPPGPAPGSRWLPFAGVSALALAGFVLVAALDPNRAGHYPTCPFLLLTGWWCPGCGTLRAVHDLAHLDIGGALARNPLTVLLVPVLVLAWATWLLRLTGRDAPVVGRAPAPVVGVLVALVLSYGVLRNLPGWTWLSPL